MPRMNYSGNSWSSFSNGAKCLLLLLLLYAVQSKPFNIMNLTTNCILLPQHRAIFHVKEKKKNKKNQKNNIPNDL